MIRPPWQYEDPLCAQVGGNFFFAEDRDEPNLPGTPEINYEGARKICNSCAHLVECALWGLENEEFGLWGGLSPADRKHIKSKRKPFPYKKTA
jgi:hypothetical protein